MSVEHAPSCPFGGFPSIRHNELCDITAAFCQRFVITSVLNQRYNHCLGNISTGNVEDGALLDVSAEFQGSG